MLTRGKRLVGWLGAGANATYPITQGFGPSKKGTSARGHVSLRPHSAGVAWIERSEIRGCALDLSALPFFPFRNAGYLLLATLWYDVTHQSNKPRGTRWVTAADAA